MIILLVIVKVRMSSLIYTVKNTLNLHLLKFDDERQNTYS